MWPFKRRAPASVPPPAPGPPPAPAPAPAPGPAAPTPDEGNVYGAYIKSLLDHEQDRKTALETKASAVITSSGVIVTLLFGLVAVITGAKNYKLPGSSQDWLIAAVLLFVIATGLGIITANIPVPYGQATFRADQLEQDWGHPASAARKNVAKAQLALIPIAARKNDLKVKLVIAAAAAELLALGALTVIVILILI
jgi:hypothetical protein